MCRSCRAGGGSRLVNWALGEGEGGGGRWSVRGGGGGWGFRTLILLKLDTFRGYIVSTLCAIKKNELNNMIHWT